MYGNRGLMGLAVATTGRGVAMKIGAVGALIGVVVLVMLAPFGASNQSALGACPPPGAGRGDDPAPKGPRRAIQIAYAKLIDDIAVQRGLPGRATLVALMTALQESQLMNLGYGDRDSLGLFQQRPSAGWGTPDQIMNPRYAIEAFFGGALPPDPPGLVDIDHWMLMPYTEAAQAVQVSAFPDAYARHERTARQIAEQAEIDLDRAGDPYAGRAGPRPVDDGRPGWVLDGCADSQLIDGEAVDARFPAERATVTDPTGTGGLVTPRTAAWIAAARTTLGPLRMTCWDRHAWNPSSDHPRGKACDAMVGGDARRSPEKRAAGDRIANWTLQTAAQTGVRYVIWYGQIWRSRTGQWGPYNGGGVYNPTDATGGHFDHVHISLY
jgi:hypothetical protein